MEVLSLHLQSLKTNNSVYLDFSRNQLNEVTINNQRLRFVKNSGRFFMQAHDSSPLVLYCAEEFILYPNCLYVISSGIHSINNEEEKEFQTTEPLPDEFTDWKLSQAWLIQKVSQKAEKSLKDQKTLRPKKVIWKIISLETTLIKKIVHTAEKDRNGFCCPLEIKTGMIFDIGNEEFRLN